MSQPELQSAQMPESQLQECLGHLSAKAHQRSGHLEGKTDERKGMQRQPYQL